MCESIQFTSLAAHLASSTNIITITVTHAPRVDSSAPTASCLQQVSIH
jgi:hypothetical protein